MENVDIYRKSTIEYYNQNAVEFVGATADADMGNIYEEFEKFIDRGASILDLGCGSGRDCKYFKTRGYHVVAVDASIAMCEETRKRASVEVLHLRAEDLVYVEKFDAVWACASLLHVSKRDMQNTLGKVLRALKEKGIFYGSWKYGEGYHVEKGKYYADYTEKEMRKLIQSLQNAELLKLWVTEDVRGKTKGMRWLNLLVKKMDKPKLIL